MPYKFRLIGSMKEWLRDLLKFMREHGYVIEYDCYASKIHCVRPYDSIINFYFPSRPLFGSTMSIAKSDIRGSPIGEPIIIKLFCTESSNTGVRPSVTARTDILDDVSREMKNLIRARDINFTYRTGIKGEAENNV